MGSAPLHSAVEQFVDHLRSERRLSPHTLDAYRRDLLSCCRFLESQQVADWNGVDNALLRRYVASRHTAGLSGRSLQRELSAIRTLFHYLIRERRCRQNPALDLRAPKAADRLPRLLDADQANHLLSPPSKTTGWCCAITPCSSCSTHPACGWPSWPVWICRSLIWARARFESTVSATAPA